MEHILSQLAKTKSGPSLLRREFRISGQTGETGQTEKLTFASLMHQIDSGLKRDYQENENSNWRGSSHRGRGRGYQPNRTSSGCQNCKQREDECNHCLACGDSGHVARECYRNENRGSRQGNGRRLFRRDAE